jgi:hypothetical protein
MQDVEVLLDKVTTKSTARQTDIGIDRIRSGTGIAVPLWDQRQVLQARVLWAHARLLVNSMTDRWSSQEMAGE